MATNRFKSFRRRATATTLLGGALVTLIAGGTLWAENALLGFGNTQPGSAYRDRDRDGDGDGRHWRHGQDRDEDEAEDENAPNRETGADSGEQGTPSTGNGSGQQPGQPSQNTDKNWQQGFQPAQGQPDGTTQGS